MVFVSSMHSWVTPAWGHGLKYHHAEAVPEGYGVAPARGRGLKYDIGAVIAQYPGHPPQGGVDM